MNYQLFLQENQLEDSPWAQQEYQAKFGGANNLGMTGPTYGMGPGYSRLSTNTITGEEGYWPIGSGASHGGPGSHEGAVQNTWPISEGTGGGVYEGATGRDLYQAPRYQNQVDFLNADNSGVLEGGTPASYQGGGLTGEGTDPWLPEGLATSDFPARPSGIETAPFPYASSSFFEGSPSSGLLTKVPDYSDAELQALGMKTGLSTNEALAQAYPLDYPAGSEYAAESAQALTSAEAGLGAIELAEGAESGWGGPATFAANQALNLIPTRDREKTKTPFGEEGSKSGILKGTGKGALLGATIGSAFPVIGTGIGAAVGGAAGFIGGSQGYFDSTSAPTITMSSIRRRGGGGMQGGLLGGGSMYG